MKLSDKAQASLNKVVDQFKRGDLSPVIEIARLRRHPDDRTPSDSWSLANQVIAYIQSGGQLDCRGFRQWEDVKRQVRKGARAVFILAPCARSIADDETGEERTLIVGFRSVPVFPLDMTEGEPLPTCDYTPAELPPLAEVATRLGVTVEYGPAAPHANGSYSPSRHRIYLGTHQAAVFFHELAHAAHDRIEKLSPGQHRGQETVAEFTAAVLASMYGMDHTGNAWKYIEGYARDPLTAIYKALSTVEKVLALILNGDTQ